ncbi:LOW QUALITY PROTEIN: probable glutamate receptor [Panulirus ornatus]|uniref:LOW QUALITY PROTEIN: probable glutamate receptor n=1 Tax=Panulirus ornatus TaxID=150431 RepID=UPI003A8C48A3
MVPEVMKLLGLLTFALPALTRLRHPYSNVDTLAAAGEAIDDVLAPVSQSQSSVILILDGNTSANTVFAEMGKLRAPWGVGVLEVVTTSQDALVTEDQFSQAVAEARTLRQLSRCVTVVVVSDDPAFLTSFAKWSLKGRLLAWSTRLLAVTRLPLPELQDLHSTFSVANTMLLIAEDTREYIRQGCKVYVYLPHNPQGVEPLLVASWTHRRRLIFTTSLQLFPEKFAKFTYGPTLVVAAEMFSPHLLLVQEKTTTSALSFIGPLINVLDILAKTMNFTYKYERPPDGSWGVKLENGSWTGMVGMVVRKETDIGLGPFDITATRAADVDFTRPILTETGRILGGRGRPEVDPWAFLMPLAPLVWVAILTTLLVVPVIGFLFSLCSRRKTTNTSLRSSSIYIRYIRILLQQGDSMLPNSWWEPLVVGVWMMTTLVLTRSYTGNLMSYLAVRHIPHPYQSLRDVLDDPSASIVMEDDTSYVQYYRSVKSGIFREIAVAETKGRVKSLRDVIHHHKLSLFKQGDHVLIAEDRYLQVLTSEDFSSTGRCDFYSSQERFLPFMSALIAQKDNPMVPVMSERIKSITQAGLYDHWTKEYMPNSTSCAYPPTKIAVHTSLTVHNLGGMFILLVSGHVVSTLLLGLEILNARLLQLWISTANEDPSA